MKIQHVLTLAAFCAAGLFLSGCSKSKEVAQKYLDAKASGDRVTMFKLTKSETRLDKPVITDKVVNGNEVIYSFKIEQQDGSTKPGFADMRLVVFKDKQTGEWLIDEERSAEETVKAKEAKEKK